MIGRSKLVLASGSPRRVTLLDQAGIEPDALRPAVVDETPRRGEMPRSLRQPPGADQGRGGARSVRRRRQLQAAYILAADTVVAVGRRILPKADPARRGGACLRLLSGPQPSRLYRALPDHPGRGLPPAPGRDAGALQAARRSEEIEAYIASGEWRGKAAATPSGPCRQLRRQARRLLHQRGRPAARRDRRRCSAARAIRSASAGPMRCEADNDPAKRYQIRSQPGARRAPPAVRSAESPAASGTIRSAPSAAPTLICTAG